MQKLIHNISDLEIQLKQLKLYNLICLLRRMLNEQESSVFRKLNSSLACKETSPEANLRKTSLQRRVNVITVRKVYKEALRGNPDIHLRTFTFGFETLL